MSRIEELRSHLSDPDLCRWGMTRSETLELFAHIDHLTAELARRQQQVETLREKLGYPTGRLADIATVLEVTGEYRTLVIGIRKIVSTLAATSDPGGEGTS